MNPIISIMSQGAMGAATASRLVENGLEVRTNLSGRGAASAERAAKAGMKPVSDDELSSADFLLSIVPPAEALSLAERLSPALARTARKTVFVDLNAINPETTKKVAQIVKATGALFVDGGIIGGPPRAGYDGPAYYVSGVDAKLVEALAPFGLKIVVLDGPIGAASALKMSYAGITKGLIAVSCSMILAAQRAGVSDALYEELSTSQAALLAGFTRGVPDMFSKAHRWVAEMREITGFVGSDSAEQEILSGVANFYARIARDFEGHNEEVAVLRDFFPSESKR
jgi:3-hydroxyisobutyrate dehydrogenase-like beta-hydroxyacid dehydrogenase